MNNIGVWLDKEKAHIVTIKNGKEDVVIIESGVESYHISGGSGSRLKGGPQDVVQDSRYLEREKNQLRVYFKDIVSKIEHADVIIIFGPAEASEKFKKELEERYKNINKKVKSLIKADSMTDNQVKALVRDYFNK